MFWSLFSKFSQKWRFQQYRGQEKGIYKYFNNYNDPVHQCL